MYHLHCSRSKQYQDTEHNEAPPEYSDVVRSVRIGIYTQQLATQSPGTS